MWVFNLGVFNFLAPLLLTLLPPSPPPLSPSLPLQDHPKYCVLSLPPHISFFLPSLGGPSVELWPRFKAEVHPKRALGLPGVTVWNSGLQAAGARSREGKKAKFLDLHPSGGAHLSWVGRAHSSVSPTLWTPHPVAPAHPSAHTHKQKKMAECGQTRLAKSGLAKCGLGRKHALEQFRNRITGERGRSQHVPAIGCHGGTGTSTSTFGLTHQHRTSERECFQPKRCRCLCECRKVRNEERDEGSSTRNRIRESAPQRKPP